MTDKTTMKVRFRIKCVLQVRGDDWGVSTGPREVQPHEDLGDGKTIEDLIEYGCVVHGQHYDEILEPLPEGNEAE